MELWGGACPAVFAQSLQSIVVSFGLEEDHSRKVFIFQVAWSQSLRKMGLNELELVWLGGGAFVCFGVAPCVHCIGCVKGYRVLSLSGEPMNGRCRSKLS